MLGRVIQAIKALRIRGARPIPHDSDAQYRTLVAQVPEPLFVHYDGEIVYANRAGADLLRAGSPEDLVGRKTVDLFHPDSRASILARRMEVANSGKPAPFKAHRILLDDGSTIDVETGPVPIVWDGRSAMLIAVRDISERVRMEQAIHRRESRQRDLIGTLPDAVLISQDNRVVFINPAGIALYGAQTADDMLGRSVFDLIHPDDRNYVVARQALPATIGKPLPFLELTNVRLDGTLIEVESHVALFPWDGDEARIAVIRDITQRKRLEEDLVQARKMEALGQLTGGMAHEFNNLLQAMLGYLELMRNRDRDGSVEQGEFEIMIEGAIEACLKGASITQSLLAYARKQPLRPHAVELDKLIISATEFLGGALGDSIHLRANLAKDLWYPVADPAQVQTCLVNIVINARDAMPGGGEVEIEADNTVIDNGRASALGDDAMAGEFVRLAVRDSGSGISAENLAHVFEPFFTTKEVGDGTGLGLSMVYGFAKQSNGFVVIDSALGAGTTVTLYLPRASAAELEILSGDGNGSEFQAAG